MMDELMELYQELILDHGKNPRNFGPLEGANRHADGYNPLCGDKIHLHALVDDQGIVREIRFEGQGCAISTASASIMSQTLKDKTLEEAEALFETFHALLTSDAEVDLDELDKLAVFSGVRNYPMRVKCATLAWHTLRAALQDAGEAVSTE
jgi:nitrogen fixation NifU-like protein